MFDGKLHLTGKNNKIKQMKYLLLAWFVFFCAALQAQEDSIPPSPTVDTVKVLQKPSRKPFQKTQKPKDSAAIDVKKYKIISFYRDTTHLDTSLTIQKHYKHNYLR